MTETADAPSEALATEPARQRGFGYKGAFAVAVCVGLVAALRAGSLAYWPFGAAFTFVPVLWFARLLRAHREGVITWRFRSGSRALNAVEFEFTGYPYVYRRDQHPIRFRLAFLREAFLFLWVGGFFLVVPLGMIFEGGPR